MNYRRYLVALALASAMAPRLSDAGVLGDHMSASDKADQRGKPFVALLCDPKQSQRLSDDAMRLGVSKPSDLIAAMKSLWCAVETDDVKRLKDIEQRVVMPFNVVLTGHEHNVTSLDNLQSQLGSLSFGVLPEELEVEVREGGKVVVFKRAEDLDSWQMRLGRDRWQLQSASLCECEE
jgi:hypothetical protein